MLVQLGWLASQLTGVFRKIRALFHESIFLAKRYFSVKLLPKQLLTHLRREPIEYDDFLVGFFNDAQSNTGRKEDLNAGYFGEHHGNEYFEVLTVGFNQFFAVVDDKQNLFFYVTDLADNEIKSVQKVQGSQLLARAEVHRVFGNQLLIQLPHKNVAFAYRPRVCVNDASFQQGPFLDVLKRRFYECTLSNAGKAN
jgi:hypothetical protein